MYKKILTVLLLTGIVFSQQKIGIVFSEKIRLDFEEFKDVEQQLQLELEVIQKEYQSMATELDSCLLYTSPSPRDMWTSRMPSSA